MSFASRSLPGLAGLLLAASALAAQQPSDPLVTTGHIPVHGREVPYEIHHLPVSSFPQLPPATAATLASMNCAIPQTYEAHRPENVIHASLERAGSSDWAVLCSARGTVTLLVFFGSTPGRPQVLASAPETERLQPHDITGVLGFNWGIDPASPARVREAQAGMERKPPPLNHDALADAVIEHRILYHYFDRGQWTLVEMPE